MKILFLTIKLPDLSKAGGFYADLIQELSNEGNEVTAIAPALDGQKTAVYQEGNVRVLRVETCQMIGNIPTYKKIINVLLMNPRYKRAYRKFLLNDAFDWVIMPTPPSSLIDVVDFIVKRTGAKYYLLLRDIHPESKRRFPSPEALARTDVYDECKKPYSAGKLMYGYLYRKSQRGYKKANLIGCMSPGNIDFVKEIAPYVPSSKIVLLPNWYKESPTVQYDLLGVRKKYGLEGKFVAIFGGTIGEGQAIWNIASLAKYNLENKDIMFLIVGRGLKMGVLKKMAEDDHLTNMMFLDYMPREEYEAILATADLGLITIDEKFPVPTSPSKVIGYMALHQPVLAMINKKNDYGEFYLDASGCGLWSADMDYDKMYSQFDWFVNHPDERKQMGELGYAYYKTHFTVEIVCEQLCKQLQNV